MWEELDTLQESADISLATKAHLDRSFLDLQARVHEVEDVLATFYFDDAHYSQEDMSPRIQAISDRFKKFLKQFYEKAYQSWPIKKKSPRLLWLDRPTVSQIKRDFDCLYEYCVDRNMMVDQRLARAEQPRQKMPLRSNATENVWLDDEDDRMLGVFRNFDCRSNNLNIPHPYPLLPESIRPAVGGGKKSVFKNRKVDKVRESRVAHSYAAASNASQIGRECARNDLLEAFVRFEKSDQPSEVDPREGRRERWILIYCISQTLAKISVDVPHLSFKTNVKYFLNTRLEGLPPWSPEERIFEEASLLHSHCWTHPPCWADTRYERPDRRVSTSKGTTRRLISRPSESRASSDSPLDSRPLSPESSRSFEYPFPSTRHLSELDGSSSGAGLVSELGPSSLVNTSEPGTPPPLTESSSATDQSSQSDIARGVRPSLLHSKISMLSGISEYSSKPLPQRPSKPMSDRPKAGFPYDARHPKR